MGQFIGKREWTPDEDDKLTALIDSGLRRFQLPPHFPDRTPVAVKSRARVLRPHEPEFPTDQVASRQLRDAINELIDRMSANDVAEMLGKPHLKIPGTERVYRGQAAERLAA